MTKRLRFLFLIVVLGLGFTLVACSTTQAPSSSEMPSDPSDPDPSDPSDPSDPAEPSDPAQPTSGLTQIGFFELSESQLSKEISATAGFMQYDTALPTNLPDNPLVATVDTCEVFKSGDEHPLIPIPDDIDINFSTISAGDSLSLNSSAGVYATLEKQNAFGFTIYNAEELSDIPAGLTLTIPGDEFPAFSNISIPDISGFSMTSPSSTATITPTTSFTWQSGSVADAVVELEFLAIDLSTLDAIIVTCSAKDDGAFSIPAATQAEMGADFSATGYTASRIVYSIQRKANAMLIVSSSSQ